ncbi:MAG: 3-deoxy-manno-octulosonate cytidylyltransferase [Candidatus Methylomirabilia bacterium]
MKTVIAIPARIGSTRLPGKALADICGEPLVVRVWRRCSQVRGVTTILVATDDQRICDAVRAVGGKAVLTAADHVSGTDRIAAAVRGEDCDLVVNVQGDEPFVEPGPLEALIAVFAAAAPPEAATLATPVSDAADLLNPDVVKVLVGRDGYAVYFSRHPIPWREGLRASIPGATPGACAALDTTGYLRHIGVYAYRPAFLQRFTTLEPTFGEQSERLEQLRILEHGHRIRVVITPWDALAVDTPEDLEKARERASREAGR